MPHNNERRRWELLRAKILLYTGLMGIFMYFILVEVFGAVFHKEWILVFLSMMGLGLFQAVDKK